VTIDDFKEHEKALIENAQAVLESFKQEFSRNPIEALRWPAEALRAAATIDVWVNIFGKADLSRNLPELKSTVRRFAMGSIEPTSSPAHDEFAEYRRREWSRLYDLLESVKP
jgi:hypothetical protein